MGVVLNFSGSLRSPIGSVEIGPSNDSFSSCRPDVDAPAIAFSFRKRQFRRLPKLLPIHVQDKNNIFVNLNLFSGFYVYDIGCSDDLMRPAKAPWKHVSFYRFCFLSHTRRRPKVTIEKRSMQFGSDMENNKKKFPSKAPPRRSVFCGDCTYFCCYVFH